MAALLPLVGILFVGQVTLSIILDLMVALSPFWGKGPFFILFSSSPLLPSFVISFLFLLFYLLPIAPFLDRLQEGGR